MRSTYEGICITPLQGKQMRGFKTEKKTQKPVVKACVITCPEGQQHIQINKPFYESGEVTLQRILKAVLLILIHLRKAPDRKCWS
jgi:hypothetical protein